MIIGIRYDSWREINVLIESSRFEIVGVRSRRRLLQYSIRESVTVVLRE